MNGRAATEPENAWAEALQHMQSPDLLDESGAPGDVGSHIDLAMCHLERLMAVKRGNVQALCREMEVTLAKQIGGSETRETVS